MERDAKEKIQQAKAELHQEMDGCTKFIVALEAKQVKSQEMSLQLLRHLKSAESEVQTL